MKRRRIVISSIELEDALDLVVPKFEENEMFDVGLKALRRDLDVVFQMLLLVLLLLHLLQPHVAASSSPTSGSGSMKVVLFLLMIYPSPRRSARFCSGVC